MHSTTVFQVQGSSSLSVCVINDLQFYGSLTIQSRACLIALHMCDMSQQEVASNSFVYGKLRQFHPTCHERACASNSWPACGLPRKRSCELTHIARCLSAHYITGKHLCRCNVLVWLLLVGSMRTVKSLNGYRDS